jgi:hypothetical protein
MQPSRKTRSALGALLAFALAGFPLLAAPRPQLALELEVAVARGGTVELWFDYGAGFWPGQSVSAPVPPGTTPVPVRLALPTRPLRDLRLDPTADDAEVLIAGLRLVDERGATLLRLDPRELRPRNQIATITPEAGGVRVRPVSGSNDPILSLDWTALQRRVHDAAGRATVGRGTALVLAVLLAGLLLTVALTAWRAVGGRQVWPASAALFLGVLGARLCWLNLYSRAVPFWDEWEGDALYLLIPFQGGFLDWGALWLPQWEHRILLTRVITLAGTVLNGEWDPRVAMTVSAVLYAGLVTLGGTALLATRTWAGLAAALALGLAGALPFDVNNLLWGGQTQMYGLLLLAVCVIALAAAPRVTPAVRWGMSLGSLLSLFTMGAGPLAPACAAGICLVRGGFEPTQRRAWWGLAASGLGVVALGFLLHTGSRAHLPLYAQTWAQFERAFLGAAAWPLPPHVLSAVVVWLPWAVQGLLILQRREATSVEWLSVGLGGWALVNAVALGYARQYEGPPFDTRFLTSLSVGATASLLATFTLGRRLSGTVPRGLLVGAGVCVVGGMLVAGLRGFPLAHASWQERAEVEQRVREFLATGKPASVLEKPPHHGGEAVVARLESPGLRAVLPAAFRRELQRRASAPAGAPAEAGWLTAGVRTAMKLGGLLGLLGAVGLGAWWWQHGPARTAPGRRRLDPDRVCGWLAALVPLGWWAIYHFFGRGPLVDEAGHLGAIQHFVAGKPGWPEGMPMLPGYHYLVAALWRLQPPLDLLTLARLVTTALWLLGLAAFALAWRRLHGAPAGRATLLLALFPLAQPLSAMAYTDAPALALVMVAVWAHSGGWRAGAALVLAAAVAVRQTSLAFAGLLLAHEWLQPGAALRTWLRRTAWLWGLGLLAVAGALVAGRVTLAAGHGNELRFNPAVVHFAALLALGLGLPVWLGRAPAAGRWLAARFRERPGLTSAGGVLALALGGVLGGQFANPHEWNRELFWEGHTFTLLRNWPLVWIDAHPGLRVLSGLNVVAMALAVGAFCMGQPQRARIALALLCGGLGALANSLVEPRYFVPAVGGALVFTRFSQGEWRRLVLWWGALSAVHAPFILAGWSLW